MYYLLHGSLIAQVVLAQFVLLFGSVLFTIGFLVVRNRWNVHAAKVMDQYNDDVIQLLFIDHTAFKKAMDATLPSIPFWHRSLYRDVLLSQIHVLSGHEREIMIERYLRMFYQEDRIQTTSRVWWKRLMAIIRLDVLSIAECRDVYLKKLNDPHPLVVLGATRALSRIGGEVDPQVLFQSLETVGLQRQTALIEVIANICAHYGPEIVSEYLKSCQHPDVAMACVHVLGDQRSVQAVPIFIDILRHPEKSEPLLAKVLDAIPLIADPIAIDPVKKLLTHPSSILRAKSITALIELGDTEAFDLLDAIRENDHSVEVQRALRKLQRKAA